MIPAHARRGAYACDAQVNRLRALTSERPYMSGARSMFGAWNALSAGVHARGNDFSTWEVDR